MRTGSRVFAAIGLFALVAGLGYYAWRGFDPDAIQGTSILLFFAVADGYLWYFLRKQGRADLSSFGRSPAGGDDAEHTEIHLPGPSIWPAAFGVAAFLLMLGVVLSRGLLIAGAVAVVLSSIGWALESVREYRGELARGHREPEMPPAKLVDAAEQVAAFRDEHGGADAMVAHLGLGWAEIVLVGADGAWGNVVLQDIAHAREACTLAGVTVHEQWPQGVGARVRNDEEFWRRMGGPVRDAHPHGPRDGQTQVGAKVFASIGSFGLIAGLIFFVSQGVLGDSEDQAQAGIAGDVYQGAAVLIAFAIASAYLYVMLRNARGGPSDLPFAHNDVALEPTEPDPPIDPHTLHLPGPSIWPAAFGVTALCLMLGLIVNRGLLIAGAVLTVVSSVGWAVESVREYRASIAGEHGSH